ALPAEGPRVGQNVLPRRRVWPTTDRPAPAAPSPMAGPLPLGAPAVGCSPARRRHRPGQSLRPPRRGPRIASSAPSRPPQGRRPCGRSPRPAAAALLPPGGGWSPAAGCAGPAITVDRLRDMLGAAGEDLTGLRGRALLPEYTMMAPAPSRPASIPVTCVPSPADRKCSCPAPRPTGAPPTPRSAALHGAVG